MPYVAAPTLSELNLKQDRSDWQMRDACPACTSPEIKDFADVRNFGYDRCSDCGFVFANPAPSERAASEFYNSDFYDNYRALEEENIRKTPYYSISSYTDPRRLAGWLTQEKAAKILDFGCGPASFIALLRDEFGFANVEGLELNANSAAVADRSYGIKLAPDALHLKHKPYDVILMFEVIEHLPNPAHEIEQCRDLLAPGGQLFITTPSVRNIPARYFPSHCGHYTGPSHVSLFTEESMSRLLGRLGMKIVRMETDDAPLLGRAVTSPLYNLDIQSPQSSFDIDDALFVPNIMGRAAGLKPTRAVKSLPFRLVKRAESIAQRFVAGRFSDHLYLLAERV